VTGRSGARLPIGDLAGFVVGLQRARHRIAGVTARPLAGWDAAGVWRDEQSRVLATNRPRVNHELMQHLVPRNQRREHGQRPRSRLLAQLTGIFAA
jgi:hypothetical protein